MFRLPAILAALLCLLSIGCTPTEEQTEIAFVDHKKHLEDNRTELLKWVLSIQNLQQVDSAAATGNLPTGDTLDFTAVHGTHTGNAKVNEKFNALFLSTYSFGKEKPECFRHDPFMGPTFVITNRLLHDKAIGLLDGTPMETDERFPSTAVAYMNATKQVRYVYLLDVEQFDRGSANVYAGTLTPAQLSGTVTIFDLKENKLLAKVPVNVPGFTSMGYSSKNTDGSKEQEKTANAKWDRQLVGHYRETIKKLLPTLGR